MKGKVERARMASIFLDLLNDPLIAVAIRVRTQVLVSWGSWGRKIPIALHQRPNPYGDCYTLVESIRRFLVLVLVLSLCWVCWSAALQQDPVPNEV